MVKQERYLCDGCDKEMQFPHVSIRGFTQKRYDYVHFCWECGEELSNEISEPSQSALSKLVQFVKDGVS